MKPATNPFIGDARHCDTYIRDKSQPMCLRRFLLYRRIPAYWQIKRWRWGKPELYAMHEGKRVRVTMASRFGDVGITEVLTAEYGYNKRVPVEALTDFTGAL